MVANRTVANLVLAKLGSGGAVSFSNANGSTDRIDDVIGWIPVGSALSALTPSRVLDTRFGTGGIA